MTVLREASENDRGAVYEVHVAAVRNADAPMYSEKAHTLWESTLSPSMYSLEGSESLFLVAEEGSEVVGFAEASFTDPEIDKLYVAPSYQRNGVATSLIKEIQQQIRDQGNPESLNVEASLNAVPFYESVGFKQVGTHDLSFSHGDETVTMTVADMQKDLH